MNNDTKTRNLQFGLNAAVPATAVAAWGARWIFPNDMLHDRQGTFGWDTPEGEKLKAWLNGGALTKARARAMQMSNRYEITPDGGDTVTLFEDETGIIVGNPNRSYGYLYVAGWLK